MLSLYKKVPFRFNCDTLASLYTIHIIVETIGPYLCNSMSIYTLCGSFGYPVPIKDGCTCST